MAEGEKGKGIFKIGLTVCISYNLFLAVRIHDTFPFFFLFLTFLFYFHFLLCKGTQIDWSLLSVRSNVALFSVRWNLSRDQLFLNSVKKKEWFEKRKKEVKRSDDRFLRYGIRIRRSEKKNEISGLYNFCWFSDPNVTLSLRRITWGHIILKISRF